jgi:hypothetical protein
MSMLLDLDKDYLKDMNITLMGDIINILKHSRVVANKNTSEMVLNDKVTIPFIIFMLYTVCICAQCCIY